MEKQPTQQQPIPPPYHHQDDDITLKELILKIKEFWKEIWLNKGLLILIASLLGGAFALNSYFQETTYTAAISFLVSEDEGSAATLDLGEFGKLDYSLDKLIALAKSGSIIHAVLMEKVSINEKEDLLANHIINIYPGEDIWESDLNRFSDFKFNSTNIDQFTFKEQQALDFLKSFISGNKLREIKGLTKVSYDETEIVNIGASTIDGSLSQELMDVLFVALKKFYVNETVGPIQKTLDLLEEREKTILAELQRAEQTLEIELEDNQDMALRDAGKRMDLYRKVRDIDRTVQIAEMEKAIAATEAAQSIAIAESDREASKADMLNRIAIMNAEKAKVLEEMESTLSIEKAAMAKVIDNLETSLDISSADKVVAKADAIRAQELSSNNDTNKKLSDYRTSFKTTTSRIEEDVDNLKRILEITNAKRELVYDSIVQSAQLALRVRTVKMDSIKRVIELSAAEGSHKIDSLQRVLEIAKNEGALAFDKVRQALEITNGEMEQVIEDYKKSFEIEVTQSQDLATKSANIKIENLSRKVKNQDVLYESLLKNKQSVEFLLESKTPEFQVVDRTFIPVENKPSLLKSLIIGSIMGFFLGIGYVIGRKIIRDVMTDL